MEEQLSSRVVWSVAEALGVDPVDLPPLNDVVDPDSLDALSGADGEAGLEVEFVYAANRIVLRDGEVVSVTPVGDGGSGGGARA